MILVAKLALFIFFLWLQGCQKTAPLILSLRGRTMGTTYLVKYHPLSKTPSPQEVKRMLEERLEVIDRALSTYRDDSEISQINRGRKNEVFSLGPLVQKALRLSSQVFKESEGFFDPSVGPLVNLWGHGPKRHNNPPTKKEIWKVLPLVGLHRYGIDSHFTQLSKPHSLAYLDFSASAKGLGVDELGEVLKGYGIEDYMVEIGGEILVSSSGKKDWRVGIERPMINKRGSVQAILSLQNGALATSGNYRNYYIKDGKRYGHTLNPHTGEVSSDTLLSVSVIHKNCALADAWATALLAMGKKRALASAKRLGLQAFFIVSGNKGLEELFTSSWPQTITVEDGQ